MKFIELAKKRYSCRNYSDKKIYRDTLLELLEAARIAPSAANYQPWHFVVVDEENALNKLAQAYSRDWFRKAPAVIVVCSQKKNAWTRSDGKNHSDIDMAIATDHLTLQAADIGLATCWVCNFDVKKVSEALGLPGDIEPVVLLPVGYPSDSPDVRHINRKKIEEILHWNKF
ncbi:MAG: nitroreductase family protein [Bacteroidota bacterium]|nr:nitroreductase family protein [Bacteroidota bacterium]